MPSFRSSSVQVPNVALTLRRRSIFSAITYLVGSPSGSVSRGYASLAAVVS
jgi:hypothetical protein